MQAGVLSGAGFLGDDERPLAEIVAADRATLEQAGLTVHDVADLLEHLHEVADRGFGASVAIAGGRVKVWIQEVMGRIPCPYACGFRAHKAVVTVSAAAGEFQFTPLSAHLIREHGFFEGKGSPFRIEPEELVALFRVVCGE
jgi:hypothetical protein